MSLIAREGGRVAAALLPPDPESTIARYARYPRRFVLECIDWRTGERPSEYQLEILDALVTRRRVAVRGPHGLGKTAVAAWAVLWFALTSEALGQDWKIVTTAGAWRQLTKYLWPEIHKWARRLRWDVIGRGAFNVRTELFSLSLRLQYGEAFAVASEQPELIEGAHATRLLYIFDESKAILDRTFDAAEGAFAGAGAGTEAEAFALAISTPGEPSGRFYDIHARKPGLTDWWVRHVRLDECVAAGRVAADWAEARRRQWGEQTAVYQNRVLGEFYASTADTIIPLAWVEAANDRWRELDEREELAREGFTSVGVDVGIEIDKTVLALRFGHVIAEIRKPEQGSTMATVGRVKGVIDRYRGPAVVDVIGIGAGVVDRLREMEYGHRVVAFNASERAEDRLGQPLRDRSGEIGFVNKRAAAWWHLRELLDPESSDPIALPPDDDLTGDLTKPRYKHVSQGKIMVESKGDLRVRLGRSTDAGDAVMMAFWTDIQKKAPAMLW